MMITRRGLIGSIGALIAAPAIVRASSLMPVRAIIRPEWDESFNVLSGMMPTPQQMKLGALQLVTVRDITHDAAQMFMEDNPFFAGLYAA